MPKICIITHSYPRFKGDWRSNFIESLALAYARSGSDVTVFVPSNVQDDRRSEESGGVRIVTFKYMPVESWQTIGYGHSMIGDLRMHPGDVLLMPLLLFFGTIRFTALLQREQFDFIHAHWAIPNALVAILGRFLARSRTKILTSCPGSDVTVITQLGWFGRILAKIVAQSDYLSCDGSDTREDLASAGIPQNKVDLVIYGVDPEQIHFSQVQRDELRRAWGVSKDDIVLLIVGRFVAKKGFSTAFHALKYITDQRQNIKLVVVGDGPLKDEYLAILKQNSTARYATFIGEVPKQDLSKYYSSCDIFLMPSRRLPSHGLNVVVCEAMACSRPIVASNVGGNTLVVFPGTNGYLHDEGNSQQLAEFVLKLAEDSLLRKEMGQNSLHLIKERFNWDAIARHYLAKYRELT